MFEGINDMPENKISFEIQMLNHKVEKRYLEYLGQIEKRQHDSQAGMWTSDDRNRFYQQIFFRNINNKKSFKAFNFYDRNQNDNFYSRCSQFTKKTKVLFNPHLLLSKVPSSDEEQTSSDQRLALNNEGESLKNNDQINNSISSKTKLNTEISEQLKDRRKQKRTRSNQIHIKNRKEYYNTQFNAKKDSFKISN